jgi:hypothetical protein
MVAAGEANVYPDFDTYTPYVSGFREPAVNAPLVFV